MALKFAVNNSLSDVTSLPTAIPTGSMTLLQTQTASSSSTIDFTSNIDSTYDVYCFKFINIHGSATSQLKCNFSTDGGSNYNVTKTTTNFLASHNEDDSANELSYNTGRDLAQSTSDMFISSTLKTDNDSSYSGEMYLYNPSSSVFVKHFMIVGNSMGTSPRSIQDFFAGYGNTTSPIDAVKFLMGSGNIDSGDIKLYGIS